jgi:predicted enzyme related to lactoylglutathione lyase
MAPFAQRTLEKSIIAAIVAVAATLVIAAALSPRLSASTPRAGEFVWHDLITDDDAASRAFYGSLFGWTFQPGKGVEPNYIVIRHNGSPIGGIVTVEKTRALPQWLTYVMVENVDKASAAFSESGGRVYRGPLDVRKDLRVAVVGDAQGAPLGLASRGRETPDAGPPPENRWLWMEYVAVDADRALAFYSRVVGFTSDVLETREGRTYHLLKTDRPRAGLFLSPWKRENSVWLPYVRVSDPSAMAAKVPGLGGAVVLSPTPAVRNGSLAIVLDPGGAPLALQKFPFESKVTP